MDPNIGRRIAALRNARGWTQTELGRRVGTSKVYIAQLEGGFRNPGTDLCVKLADAFGITLDELVRGASPKLLGGNGSIDADAPAEALSGAA